MDNFSKDGRKLRPRKAAGTGTHKSEKVEFSHNSSPEREFGGSRRAKGDDRTHYDRPSRPYGERRPSRPVGEGRQERDSRPARPYGEGRPAYGDNPRRSFGGPRRSFSGPKREYGPRREGDAPQGGSGEGRRSFGTERSFGPKRSFGHKSSFGPRPSSSDTGRDGAEARFPGHGREGAKRSFGPGREGAARPFGPKRTHAFNERSEEGINRMISRRPLVENTEEPQEISVPVFKEEVRLNKFIANSGVCSRREADTLIQAGVVTVNGEVVTELGVKINVTNDDIRFNGQRLKGEDKVYIIINKPKGFVTTASDPHADKTVMDLVKGCSARVYPVGRLDKSTTGVLMLTNDGEMAERLSHPAYEKKKIYQVSLDKELRQEDYEAIMSGITLSDGPVNADSLEYIDESDRRKLGIEIHSGKNRIVRRIFEHLGYNVKALDRVYFAGLTKKGLKKGEWRYLSESEVNILRMGAYM